MANKFTFALLGLLCLVPVYQTAPVPDSQESSEEVNIKAFLEHLKLVLLTFKEYSDLYEDILEKGPKIFSDVLKDPKVTEVKNEEMEKQTKILQDYLDKLEKAKGENKKEHVFELVDEYDDILNKFNGDQNDLTPEGKIIEKSLEEHGLEDLPKTIRAHFDKFLVKFNAEAETYINGLTEKEKKDENNFIEWYEKMKSESDTDKKIEMFDDFFDADDD